MLKESILSPQQDIQNQMMGQMRQGLETELNRFRERMVKDVSSKVVGHLSQTREEIVSELQTQISSLIKEIQGELSKTSRDVSSLTETVRREMKQLANPDSKKEVSRELKQSTDTLSRAIQSLSSKIDTELKQMETAVSKELRSIQKRQQKDEDVNILQSKVMEEMENMKKDIQRTLEQEKEKFEKKVSEKTSLPILFPPEEISSKELVVPSPPSRGKENIREKQRKDAEMKAQQEIQDLLSKVRNQEKEKPKKQGLFSRLFRGKK